MFHTAFPSHSINQLIHVHPFYAHESLDNFQLKLLPIQIGFKPKTFTINEKKKKREKDKKMYSKPFQQSIQTMLFKKHKLINTNLH